MIINFLLIFSLYNLVLLSVIGFGTFFVKIFFDKSDSLNYGYCGLFGILFLILYSYTSSFFYSHSLQHNSILILIGLFLFIYFFNKDKKKEILFCFAIFITLFISLIIFKTHDDFPYYHFAYSYYLTQDPLMIGTGLFNHGFRTPSSIFYLNSIFYLPFVEFYFFHLASILILGFVNLIFIRDLFIKLKTNNYDFIFYFSLLSILFINIFFYRIAEHGTDRSAQILIFLLFAEILFLIHMKIFNDFQLSKILSILAVVISLKAFYVLYILILLPVAFFLKSKSNFLKMIKIFLQNPSFYFFCLMFFLILILNLFNSGCLLYPVHFTCLNDLSWAISNTEVINMNNWYEQWSKAGATPNFRVENPEIYIQGFNWFKNWIEIYFFNKVSDFLLGIFFIIIFLIIIFYSKRKKKLNLNRNVYFLYFLIFVLLIEWFYNHPSLRYGGYVLISIFLFIPSALVLSTFNLDTLKIKKRLVVLLMITFIIFFTRNITRINDEIDKYNFKPFIDNSFRISEHHYRLHNLMHDLTDNYEKCDSNDLNCDENLNLDVKKKWNTYIFVNNK